MEGMHPRRYRYQPFARLETGGKSAYGSVVDAGGEDVQRLELLVPVLDGRGEALDWLLRHQAELRIDVGLLLLVRIRMPALRCAR